MRRLCRAVLLDCIVGRISRCFSLEIKIVSCLYDDLGGISEDGMIYQILKLD